MQKSKHNVYPEFSDQVVERWIKTTIHAVGGTRLDPYKPDSRIAFLLMSDEGDYDFNSRTLGFNYENDVIELYSERESKLFTAINRASIQSGLLVRYNEVAPQVDETNALTDEEISTILRIKNPAQLKARLKKISAKAALMRINKALTPDHGIWYLNAITARLNELETES